MNHARHGILDPIIEVFLRGYIEIFDPTALKTHEVIVLINECVVAAGCFSEVELPNLSLLLENIQIPIDSSKRNPGHLLPHPVEYPLGRRM